MRRWRCGGRELRVVALLVVLVDITVVGYAVLLLLHQPLTQLELLPHVSQPADGRSSRGSRPLPAVDLGLESRSFCDGHLIAFGQQFALLTSVVIDRRHCRLEREGGESINAVINQPESVEYYRFDRGCFRLPCSSAAERTDRLEYLFSGKKNHLNEWIRSVKLTRGVDAPSKHLHDSRVQRFTIAVTRYEYANLYHTMTDWYNAFLLMCFFNETADHTDILFVDAHPHGTLDLVWQRLFRRTLRLSNLSAEHRTSFDRLVWGWLGYNSLMTIYQQSPSPPLLEQFRSFFLKAYDLPSAATIAGRPDCADERLNILFIWRRDYVAHPRNPEGSVTRKIANEDELVRRVTSQFPRSRVTGVQIDRYTMDKQLRMIVNTDILIGMHGAGLTHVMFLRSTSALIELSPSYWSPGNHFSAIASWRQLVYLSWVNNILTLERPDGRSTVVPPSVVVALVRNAVRRICPSSAHVTDAARSAVPRPPLAAGVVIPPSTSAHTR